MALFRSSWSYPTLQRRARFIPSVPEAVVSLAVSQTLQDATLSASIGPVASIATAQSLAGAQLLASIVVLESLAVSQTLEGAALSATLSMPIAITVEQTLQAATLAATINQEAGLSITATLEDAVGSASLQVVGSVSFSQTLQDATLAAALQALDTLVVSQTLQDATLAGTVQLDTGGIQLSATLQGATLAAAMQLPIAVAVGVTLENAEVQLAVQGIVAMVVSQTLQDAQVAASLQIGERSLEISATLEGASLAAILDTEPDQPQPEQPSTGGGVLPVRYRRRPRAMRPDERPRAPISNVEILLRETPDTIRVRTELVPVVTGGMLEEEDGILSVLVSVAENTVQAHEDMDVVMLAMEADWSQDDLDVEAILSHLAH